MVEIRQEPSMEDILASIKRIIAEDGSDPPERLRRNGTVTAPAAPAEDVLELTEELPSAPMKAQTEPAPVEKSMKADSTLVSPDATLASRQSLSALSSLLVKPAAGQDDTLEGLVREMLRPMLKEWLDAKLPELVEAIVTKEIKRITAEE